MKVSDIHHVLKKYWTYDHFRPLQKEIIQSVIEGQDTLALLPTGGGKSICFQVPGLILEGICLVVSPLVALMKDQVNALKARGIRAEYIYSGMSYREVDTVLDNCVYGDIKFLYVSPERMISSLAMERIQRMPVSFIAVDEAHCISQWGHDFRPSYLKIRDIRALLPKTNLIALTATATSEVKDDIVAQLEMQSVATFSKSFLRPNLSYSVFCQENKIKELLRVLDIFPGSSIVYVRTRRQVGELASLLIKRGISTGMYHAGMPFSARNLAQANWITNKVRVMVATNAFGMGIDKSDVRSVIHWAPPASLEAYYQEAGRAGRDEKQASVSLIFSPADLNEAEALFELNSPSIEEIREVYQSLANFLGLALGSGQGDTYNFDLSLFAARFKLNPRRTHSCLKVLERNELIHLSDAVFNPSRLMLLAEPFHLRPFLLHHVRFEPLVELLLRSYEGIYEQEVRISEAVLGRVLGHSEEEVIRNLEFLASAGILKYTLRTDLPRLTFMLPREEARYLQIDYLDYNQRKKTLRKQLNAILNYCINEAVCRNKLILEYFGEILEEPCGKCDICIKQRQGEVDDHILQQKLFELLQNRNYSLLEIENYFPEINSKQLSTWLRMLADRGLIHIRNGLELSLNS